MLRVRRRLEWITHVIQSAVNALCVWWRERVKRVPRVLRRRPPDGVRARGPTGPPPLGPFGIISTRIIIDDRAVTGARRGVSLETRSRAGGYYGQMAGEEGDRSVGHDGYYLSMKIDLERGQFSRLRSIGRGYA